MQPQIRALLFATLLLFSTLTLVAHTAQAVGSGAQIDDIWRQLAGTGSNGASQSCSVGYRDNTANSIQLQGGHTYIYAEGMGAGGLSPGGVTMHVSGNSTTLISKGPLANSVGGGMDPATIVEWFSGGVSSGSGFYNVTQFKMPYTANVFFDYFYSGSGSCFTQDGFVNPPLPPGVTAGNQMTGWVADIIAKCPNSCVPISRTVGYILDADVVPIGEQGILSTETTRTPTTSQFAWTQIAGDQLFVNTPASATNTLLSGVQSFAPNLTTQGKFVDTSTFLIAETSAPCNGATLQISFAKVLNYPWDPTQEIANMSMSVTQSTGASNTQVTVDWSNGLISSADPAHTSFGAITFKAAGTTVTAGTANFFNNFPPSLAGAGTAYFHWNFVSAPGACGIQTGSSSTYPNGFAYTDGGTQWTQQTTQDLAGWVMNVYGGVPLIYSFTESASTVGGARYAYICEVQKDSNAQRYTLSSSYGGGARLGSFQAAGNSICANPVIASVGGTLLQQTIQEWRLGFETIPVNSTATVTVTIDSTGSSRNLLYIGTFTGSQPTTHLHLQGPYTYTPAATNSLSVYGIFSTDDYFTQVFFQVRACVNLNADGTCGDVTGGVNTANGAIIPNGSYSGTVSVLRAIAGAWDANGQFNITGQDIPGGVIALTIQATGFTTDNQVQVTVPSGGIYYVNLTMTPGGATGISVKQGGVTCTFDNTSPMYVTGQLISINISRSKTVELWFTLFKIANGGTSQVTSMFDWTTSLNNTQLFAYPNGQTLQAADSGQYVLAAFTPTTSSTKGTTICYDTIGVNQAGNFPVSSNLVQDLNTVAQTSIQTASQIQGATGTKQAEATTYDDYLALLDWGFSSLFFGIPNMVVILFVFLGGALLLRFGRGSGGG